MKEIVKKVRDHKGERNPHFGCIMSDASRKAIARSQRTRFDYYKKAAASIVTEDRVREIILETIRDYLTNNTQDTKNNKPNNIPL